MFNPLVVRMKVFLLLALLAGVIPATGAATLETRSFVVDIDVRCPEGDVICNDVIYFGKSKKTGKSVTLRGRTMHSRCADGETPCQFQGYVFKSERTSYTVMQDGELIVMQGEKTLVQERGTWK